MGKLGDTATEIISEGAICHLHVLVGGPEAASAVICQKHLLERVARRCQGDPQGGAACTHHKFRVRVRGDCGAKTARCHLRPWTVPFAMRTPGTAGDMHGGL